MDAKTEIILTATGLVTTITAWFLGGKHKVEAEKKIAQNNSYDPITRGADNIVSATERLIDRLEKLLEEERVHRATCEEKLQEFERRLNERLNN